MKAIKEEDVEKGYQEWVKAHPQVFENASNSDRLLAHASFISGATFVLSKTNVIDREIVQLLKRKGKDESTVQKP